MSGRPSSCARVTLGPWDWNSYFTWGFVGYLAGLGVSLWLGLRAGLGTPALLVVAIAPPIAFLAAVRAVTAIAGYQRLVFYEQAIPVVIVSALLARLAGAPVGVALDVLMLGVGAFLALGRVGCFHAGCCHGRPFRAGVVYGAAHVDDGFPPRLAGVSLLPVQLADGTASAAFVILALWSGAPTRAGSEAAIWVAGYGCARFVLELVRGDPRPMAAGLSEAQLTAVASSGVAAVLRPQIITIACAALASGAALVLLAAHRVQWPRAYWLTHPNHLVEIEDLLVTGVTGAAAPGHAITTTEGLRASVHALEDRSLDLVVSSVARPLDLKVTRSLAGHLGARWQARTVVAGRANGLFHIILRHGGATFADRAGRSEP